MKDLGLLEIDGPHLTLMAKLVSLSFTMRDLELNRTSSIFRFSLPVIACVSLCSVTLWMNLFSDFSEQWQISLSAYLSFCA